MTDFDLCCVAEKNRGFFIALLIIFVRIFLCNRLLDEYKFKHTVERGFRLKSSDFLASS
ncbi:hypothetical protein HCUR_00848 [Holospora curviuscula]|uniref:Uncharacterized protein n=1 Tax=Holospora curviuscula TaxID=1082868 RepID=A0A2S5R8P0_9PROT|nr:hypothetical protein HCUR_00848 [Holospora curviuscula]